MTALCRARGIDPVGRSDPGRARRALRLRRHPGRHGRADLGHRALRRRGSRVDRRARRQPPRVQFPDRGPDHGPARRGTARRRTCRSQQPRLRPPSRRARGWTPPPGRPWPRPCHGDAGVLRDHEGLERLRQTAGPGPARGRSAGLDLATVEATNLHAVSVLVAVAALARAESRGCHRWRDAPPVSAAERARHTVVRVAAGQPRVPAPSGQERGSAHDAERDDLRTLLAAGLDPEDTERVVRGALDEDLRYGPDLTSAATAAPGARAAAGRRGPRARRAGRRSGRPRRPRCRRDPGRWLGGWGAGAGRAAARGR